MMDNLLIAPATPSPGHSFFLDYLITAARAGAEKSNTRTCIIPLFSRLARKNEAENRERERGRERKTPDKRQPGR